MNPIFAAGPDLGIIEHFKKPLYANISGFQKVQIRLSIYIFLCPTSNTATATANSIIQNIKWLASEENSSNILRRRKNNLQVTLSINIHTHIHIDTHVHTYIPHIHGIFTL